MPRRRTPSPESPSTVPRGPVLPLVTLPDNPAVVLSFYGVPENVVIRSTWTDDGVRYDEPIRAADLTWACGDVEYRTGLLPAGVLASGWAAGFPFYVMYIAAQRWTLPAVRNKQQAHRQVEHFATYELPLPPLIWTGWKTNYRVYATRDTTWPETPDSQLFHAPLPNVYATGSICWGSETDARPLASPATMGGTLRLLMNDTWFSDHSANARSQRFRENIIDMWDAVIAHGLAAYPLDDLCESPYRLAHVLEGRVWQ